MEAKRLCALRNLTECGNLGRCESLFNFVLSSARAPHRATVTPNDTLGTPINAAAAAVPYSSLAKPLTAACIVIPGIGLGTFCDRPSHRQLCHAQPLVPLTRCSCFLLFIRVSQHKRKRKTLERGRLSLELPAQILRHSRSISTRRRWRSTSSNSSRSKRNRFPLFVLILLSRYHVK